MGSKLLKMNSASLQVTLAMYVAGEQCAELKKAVVCQGGTIPSSDCKHQTLNN